VSKKEGQPSLRIERAGKRRHANGAIITSYGGMPFNPPCLIDAAPFVGLSLSLFLLSRRCILIFGE
jgi:hypothetical protein